MTVKDGQRKKLREITDVILDGDSHPGILLNACHEMYSLFSDITGVGEESKQQEDQKDIFFESGKALAPIDAARCVNDMARTSKYLRGLHDGIAEAMRRFEGGPINVIYAGCGPYATLAVPLMTRFAPDRVKFTLMDINKRSLGTAKALINELGFESFVDDYILCDAVNYKLPEGKPAHLVITETMQRAFNKEPQVALTLNLASQLAKGGIFIPERITISACLAHLGSELKLYPAGAEIPEEDLKDPARNRKRLSIGTLLDFTAESAIVFAGKIKVDGKERPAFPPITIQVPEEIDGSFDAIMLLTHIDVYGPHRLRDYDSSLTNPLVLNDIGKPKKGSRIEFSYLLGERPGFEWRMVE